MPKPDRVSPIAALALVALFIFGLSYLLFLRFQAGDVYPPYSSLRADPLGTKILYESLEGVPGLAVSRHFEPMPKLHGCNATVFFLGELPFLWTYVQDTVLAGYEAISKCGGRVVIGFLPVSTDPMKPEGQTAPPTATPPKTPKGATTTKKVAFETLMKLWKMRLGYRELPKGSEAMTPQSLPRDTILYLVPQDDTWKVLLARGGQAVIAERRFGKGSIVLVADGFLLSNEGIHEARQTPLLAQLVGSSSRVVFDENHLGISERGSVGTLARKYRLHGAFAALLLLAVLFVWKSSASLVPPAEDHRQGAIAGRDSFAGFVSVLRRGIPKSELLRACAAEWKKSQQFERAPARRMDRIDAATLGSADPVEGYKTICRILKERSG